MVSEHHLSERRACRLVRLSRDSYRHPPEADRATVEVHEKIVEIAHVLATGASKICCARSFPGSITSVCTASPGKPTWPCAVARRASVSR